eukprot:TRINITY_DN67664_c5_g1_i1.p1 TRINITY_DN67664_c5_g1~~TRINITY_DN67664_c5_g1_i1.p1  ORF type:complete len:432 (+),score=42.36 TRINITY_DN67664_c5_g1_i1:14-1309(+)
MGGNHSAQLVKDKPIVLVLGGGYVGCTCARALDDTGKFNVVLIDRKNFFLHNVASLRAVVDPTWIDKIMIPYDKLLRNGMVVQAEIEEVAPTQVKLFGREDPVKFDYLVIALGSSYAFPAKISETTAAAAKAKYLNLHKLLAARKDICIVGGGPVGVELAGEIVTDFPQKKVTIVQSQNDLCPGPLSPKFKDEMLKKLTVLGVNVLLGQRVNLDEETMGAYKTGDYTFIDGSRDVVTTKGEKIHADIIFICTGLAVNNASLTTYFGDKIQQGRLAVNKYLQVEGHSNIFAIGDINNTPELKMAYFGQMQAQLTAKNIQALQKRSGLTPHKSPTPAMFVTIGRYGGVGQLPFANMVVGDTVIKKVKSKDIFCHEYYKLLRQGDGSDMKTGIDGAETRTVNLAAAMGMTAEEAAKLRDEGLNAGDHEQGANHT